MVTLSAGGNQSATRRLRWGEIRAANCLWQNLNITHKHEASAWLGYGFGTACDFFDFPIKLLFQRNSHSFMIIHLNVHGNKFTTVRRRCTLCELGAFLAKNNLVHAE
jgi:hypothetical protein